MDKERKSGWLLRREMTRLRFALRQISLVILPIGILLYASFQNMIGAQEKEKSIEIEKLLNTPVPTPVALLDVAVSGQSVKGNSKLKSKGKKHEIEEVKFKAGDNWLKDLSATLQNISDKPIIRVKIDLWIEHPALERPVVAHLLRSFNQRGSVTPLQPGSSVVLAMDEQHYDHVIRIWNVIKEQVRNKWDTKINGVYAIPAVYLPALSPPYTASATYKMLISRLPAADTRLFRRPGSLRTIPALERTTRSGARCSRSAAAR